MYDETQETQDSSIARRRLLRRAGTVAAGVVGAGAVSAVVANPAQAAPDDNLVEGLNDNAVPTTISGTSPQPMFTVGNAEGPALCLVPGNPIDENAAAVLPQGAVSMDSNGTIWATLWDGFPDYVHTTLNTNQLAPIIPQRVLDTRSAAGRRWIINPSGNLDSSGRLLHNRTIHVHLNNYVALADALHGNATVAAAVNGGYLTIYPYGSARPATSSLNYPASRTLGSLSNAVLTGLGESDEWPDVISIYNYGGPTHVILDAVAFTLTKGIAGINPAIVPAGRSAARTTQRSAGQDIGALKARRDEIAKKWQG